MFRETHNLLRLFWLCLCATGLAYGQTGAPGLLRDEGVSGLQRVVVASDPHTLSFYDPQPERIHKLVERGVMALTGAPSVPAAWAHFVKPHDVVGIKINSLPGPTMGTRKPVVDAIVAGLRAAGVRAENIIIWDRQAEDLVAAGWEIRREGTGPLCTATLPYIGWDEALYYQTPQAGTIIWGDFEFGARQISERSYYSKLVSRTVTKLINVPVLIDNRHVGISGCLYNMAIGSVDNNRRFQTESLHYDAGIAELCRRPPIAGKLVLNILDSLIAQYAGGPKFQPQVSWTPGTLYFSPDPVAIDSLALAEIEKRRLAASMPTMGARARHVHIAAEIGVGVEDRRKMEILEVNP